MTSEAPKDGVPDDAKLNPNLESQASPIASDSNNDKQDKSDLSPQGTNTGKNSFRRAKARSSRACQV